MKILVEKAVIEQALEVIELMYEWLNAGTPSYVDESKEEAITALREALAEQAEQEQVAVLDITYGREPECYATPNAEDLPEGTYRLYAAPVQQAEQTPVATYAGRSTKHGEMFSLDKEIPAGTKLYAAPVRTKDLTYGEKFVLIKTYETKKYKWTAMDFIDAVIAADRRKNNLCERTK